MIQSHFYSLKVRAHVLMHETVGNSRCSHRLVCVMVMGWIIISEKNILYQVSCLKSLGNPQQYFSIFFLSWKFLTEFFSPTFFFFSAFKMNIFSLKFFILTCICTKKTFSPPDFLAVNENASDFEKKKGKKNENYTDLYMYIIKYIYPQHSHLILH